MLEPSGSLTAIRGGLKRKKKTANKYKIYNFKHLVSLVFRIEITGI